MIAAAQQGGSAGVIALLMFAIFGMLLALPQLSKWYIARDLYDAKVREADNARAEFGELLPAIEKIADLSERQWQAQQVMFKKLDDQETKLDALAQDVKLISYEVNHRRLNSGDR